MTRQEVLDRYFIAARAQLLDVAAFLDRLERSAGKDDFRTASFKAALPVLSDDHPEKTRRILELMSDPSREPVAQAENKSAAGAWPGFTAKASKK